MILTNIDMMRLVPHFLANDRNGHAMVQALQTAMDAVNRIVSQGVETVMDPKTAPEWRLDELAWEYHITWYDYDADIEIKRAQIIGAMEYSGQLGTPAAVMRAIEDVYGAGWVSEWWDYGGDAYHYAINTTNLEDMIANRDKLNKILGASVPVRAVLDNIFYSGGSSTAATAVLTGATGVETQVIVIAV